MRQMLRNHEQAGPGPSAGVATGYVLTYRPGYTNFCPGCGQAQWHVGRHTAECAFCTTALPIAVMPGAPVGAGAAPWWRFRPA